MVEKRPVSFRLDPDFMELLGRLKGQTGYSFTTIIMLAVREWAKRQGVK